MSEQFDEFAADYEGALEQGISLSGEDSAFFAQARVAWTGRQLAALRVEPRNVLDFGCGTGSTTPHLLRLAGVERVVGTDVSSGLLDVARRDHAEPGVEFVHLGAPTENAFDVAYCNGVFHHIAPAERRGAMDHVFRSLRPGGVFALWENNPWNPGTRLVMRRIPFDRDAQTLSVLDARRLLRDNGFAVLRSHFQFIFPKALRVLRPVEPLLARAPLGAQYLVLAQKPTAG